MPSQNQIIGGAFQDSLGNVLNQGYLTFKISDDAQIPGVGQLGAGTVIKVLLDVNGNVAGTVNIWPNSVLVPATTLYIITAYSAKGETVWQKTRAIPTSPSPYPLQNLN